MENQSKKKKYCGMLGIHKNLSQRDTIIQKAGQNWIQGGVYFSSQINLHKKNEEKQHKKSYTLHVVHVWEPRWCGVSVADDSPISDETGPAAEEGM